MKVEINNNLHTVKDTPFSCSLNNQNYLVSWLQIWCIKKETVIAFILMPKDGIYRMKAYD